MSGKPKSKSTKTSAAAEQIKQKAKTAPDTSKKGESPLADAESALEAGEAFLDEPDDVPLGVVEPSPVELEAIEEKAQVDVVDEVPLAVSNDPVRMYLREIGQIALLKPHQEIWLATQRETDIYLKDLQARLSEQGKRVSTKKKNADTLNALLSSLREIWSAVRQNCRRLKLDAPDLSALIDEAKQTCRTLLPAGSSYLYQFLAHAGWINLEGRTGAALAGHLFDVFILLHLLPDPTLDIIRTEWIKRQKLPSMRRLKT